MRELYLRCFNPDTREDLQYILDNSTTVLYDNKDKITFHEAMKFGLGVGASDDRRDFYAIVLLDSDEFDFISLNFTPCVIHNEYIPHTEITEFDIDKLVVDEHSARFCSHQCGDKSLPFHIRQTKQSEKMSLGFVFTEAMYMTGSNNEDVRDSLTSIHNVTDFLMTLASPSNNDRIKTSVLNICCSSSSYDPTRMQLFKSIKLLPEYSNQKGGDITWVSRVDWVEFTKYIPMSEVVYLFNTLLVDVLGNKVIDIINTMCANTKGKTQTFYSEFMIPIYNKLREKGISTTLDPLDIKRMNVIMKNNMVKNVSGKSKKHYSEPTMKPFRGYTQ